MSRKRAEILVTQSLGPINDPILVQDHVVPRTPSSCWMRAPLCRSLTVDRLKCADQGTRWQGGGGGLGWGRDIVVTGR